MKQAGLLVLALGLAASAPLSQAAGRTTTASIDVTFRIVESCAIQANESDAAAGAQVNCAYGAPYQVRRSAAQAPSAVTQTAPAVLTIAF